MGFFKKLGNYVRDHADPGGNAVFGKGKSFDFIDPADLVPGIEKGLDRPFEKKAQQDLPVQMAPKEVTPAGDLRDINRESTGGGGGAGTMFDINKFYPPYLK